MNAATIARLRARITAMESEIDKYKAAVAVLIADDQAAPAPTFREAATRRRSRTTAKPTARGRLKAFIETQANWAAPDVKAEARRLASLAKQAGLPHATMERMRGAIYRWRPMEASPTAQIMDFYGQSLRSYGPRSSKDLKQMAAERFPETPTTVLNGAFVRAVRLKRLSATEGGLFAAVQ